MIRLDKLKLFPFKTQEIYFPGMSSYDIPLNIVFFPENSNFNLAYRKLKIQKRFARYGSVLPAKMPRLIWNREIISQYMLFKLMPIRNFNPQVKNVFFDSTLYLTKVDARYKKESYRRPMVLQKIQQYICITLRHIRLLIIILDLQQVKLYQIKLLQVVHLKNLIM
jgi:hypothetical protein